MFYTYFAINLTPKSYKHHKNNKIVPITLILPTFSKGKKNKNPKILWKKSKKATYQNLSEYKT